MLYKINYYNLNLNIINFLFSHKFLIIYKILSKILVILYNRS